MKKMFALVAVALIALANLTLAVLAPAQVAHASVPRVIAASVTKDWGSLVDAAGASQDVTVMGANLGDFCRTSMSLDISDMTMTCWIKSANTARVRMQNESGSTVDLASGTLRVEVIPRTNTGG